MRRGRHGTGRSATPRHFNIRAAPPSAQRWVQHDAENHQPQSYAKAAPASGKGGRAAATPLQEIANGRANAVARGQSRGHAQARRKRNGDMLKQGTGRAVSCRPFRFTITCAPSAAPPAPRPPRQQRAQHSTHSTRAGSRWREEAAAAAA